MFTKILRKLSRSRTSTNAKSRNESRRGCDKLTEKALGDISGGRFADGLDPYHRG